MRPPSTSTSTTTALLLAAAAAAAGDGFLKGVAAFPTTVAFTTRAGVVGLRHQSHIHHQPYDRLHQKNQDTTTQGVPGIPLFVHAEEQDLDVGTGPSGTEELLPDYGKTSVDIDQHKLEKRSRWRRKDLFGDSLVEQTLKELETDEDFLSNEKRVQDVGRAELTREERAQRRRALDSLGVPDFHTFLSDKMGAEGVVRRAETEVFQINIGLYCNQACGHCHVESSPLRKEMMESEIVVKCLDLLKTAKSVTTLDITGGAPELNRNFRFLVRMARELRPDIDIIDRCNLTVLQEPGQEDLVDFLKENRVHVIASLPCYSADNVDAQRGSGVFDRSIAALLALNDAGYGTDLPLDLVYNPLGAFLPPPQAALEEKYKEMLDENFGILFNSLFTMTNMPVKRFADFLHRRDELKEYMDLLVRNFNAGTVSSLMCVNTVSVGFDGMLYDCDFNQQLGFPIGSNGSHESGISVFDIDSLGDLLEQGVHNDNHCFGCTAGMGSS